MIPRDRRLPLFLALVIVGVTSVVGLAIERQQTAAAAALTVDSVVVKPTLDRVDHLLLDVVSLKQQLAGVTADLHQCRGQLAPQAYKNTMDGFAGELTEYVATFEKKWPGWTIDLRTRQVIEKKK